VFSTHLNFLKPRPSQTPPWCSRFRTLLQPFLSQLTL